MSNRLPEPSATRELRGSASADKRRLGLTLELVFWVHMEMADLADQVLEQYGLGRPHHRALYFVVRRPGINVGELMSILRITNQALSRTINQLVKMDLIEQRSSNQDRRNRCHFPTAKGISLDQRLTKRQFDHIDRSLAGVSKRDLEIFWDVLRHMVREQDKPWISDV
jgi:DNA-binding MarR family transcriptional regulator